ncbi:hypothetical protein KCP78_15725 [Salmonella enterica subsp. enterica]|nr:hypothetical protein KCP78_15725 [Salmonella enterica subsp. enterica]
MLAPCTSCTVKYPGAGVTIGPMKQHGCSSPHTPECVAAHRQARKSALDEKIPF